MLLFLGLLLLTVGIAICGYSIASGGFEVGDPLGREAGSDSGLVLLGFVALAGGGLVAALGGLVAKSVRRPGGHRGYGGYLDGDDW